MKILFVCYGNICRSPTAECVMARLLEEAGRRDVEVDSAATSREEIGHGIHRPARAILEREGIPVLRHAARQITKRDVAESDLIVGMDGGNLSALRGVAGEEGAGKLRLLGDYAGIGEIADPWWTGDYEAAYREILAGCQGLLARLEEGGAA